MTALYSVSTKNELWFFKADNLLVQYRFEFNIFKTYSEYSA